MSVCTCQRCATPAAVPGTPTLTPVPELPAEPRRFLVHTSCGPQDCTLHADGRITMRAGGQTYCCAYSSEEMFSPDEPGGANWSRCRVDWDVADEDLARAMEPLPGRGQLFATETETDGAS